MTTMNGTVVPGILPLLVLRHPSPSDNVFPDFNPNSGETIYPVLSNVLSANVNMRGILSSRFSCSPESGENILHQIIEGDGRTHEAKYTCLVSSFEQAEHNETSSPAILSYVTGGNRNNDVKYKATKMTKGILLAAIQIFDKNYGGSSDTTITSMFQKYVQTLTANIPTSNEQNALAEFIRSFMLDRIKQNPESYWGGQDCLARCKIYLNELEEEAGVSDGFYRENRNKFLRNFIHKNFAMMTKVIASFIDGNHRVLGLDSVITGCFPANGMLEPTDKYFEADELIHLQQTNKHFLEAVFLETDFTLELSRVFVSESILIAQLSNQYQPHDLVR